MSVSPEEAEAAGFASFNNNPHLCLEIPDGQFTISARTSTGRQVTFAFVPYKKDGPAQCVDITDHGTTGNEVLLLSPKCGVYDTRKLPVEQRPNITCLLIEEVQECP